MHFITSSLAARAPQCHPLSAVISGSLRITSLSFTLGSISMSLERISKASGGTFGGHGIIQAASSRPSLISMAESGRPQPATQSSCSMSKNVAWNHQSPWNKTVRICLIQLLHRAKVIREGNKCIQKHQRQEWGSAGEGGRGGSIQAARFPFAIIQDGPQCDKSPNDFRAPEDKPAVHLENCGDGG